ncbi:MAG TPA: hypothetical protein VMY06_06055, partial [Sedimentisphaerales bacterium]|nr:hypothetical protein [Sedimentisphaerales bacterium]
SFEYARQEFEVTRVLAATVGYEIGEGMGPEAGAVAAVQTVTMAIASASGTFTITVKGHTTAPIAWNATVAQVNTALDLAVVRSGGVAGDITFANVGGDSMVSTNTFTWLNTLGNPADLIFDTRLLLTAGGVEAAATIATTTAGELTTNSNTLTSASCTRVLLAPVSLIELQTGDGESLRRPFLVRGPSIVNSDQLHFSAGTLAAGIAALAAVGIQSRSQAAIADVGLPR